MVKAVENQIKFTTLINSISFSGHNIINLKRGLEIFLRKNNYEKFVLCLEELYLFNEFSKSEKEKAIAKGILSSIVNKLNMLMDEEILFLEVDRYILVKKYLDKFETDDYNFKYLLIVSKILFDSKLSKRNNYSRSFWMTDESDDLPDDESFIKFKQLFENQDEECLKYMFKILDNNNSGKKRIFNRKDNIYMIWEYLLNLNNDSNISKVLNYRLNNFFNRRNKNRHLFLSSSVDLCMYRHNYKSEDLETKYEDEGTNHKIKKKKRENIDLESYFHEISENNIKLEDFFKIENEDDDEYFREEWKEKFITSQNKNSKKKESKKKTKSSKSDVKCNNNILKNDSDEEISINNLSEDDEENTILESILKKNKSSVKEI